MAMLTLNAYLAGSPYWITGLILALILLFAAYGLASVDGFGLRWLLGSVLPRFECPSLDDLIVKRELGSIALCSMQEHFPKNLPASLRGAIPEGLVLPGKITLTERNLIFQTLLSPTGCCIRNIPVDSIADFALAALPSGHAPRICVLERTGKGDTRRIEFWVEPIEEWESAIRSILTKTNESFASPCAQ